VEQELARIAGSAWGVVTRHELLLAGVGEAGIKRRAAKGLLIRQHRGVYRVGHAAESTEADYMAAVKACGEGALLMGRAAAYHQGLLRTRHPPPPEVLCPTQRRVEGVRTRRSRNIHPSDAGCFRRIPASTVSRTLVDLAADSTDDELARACHEAGVRYAIRPSHVQAVLDRVPNAKGAGRLKQVLTGETRVTLSRLERRFLELLAEAGLPLPETNVVAGSKRVDCRWPEHDLTVELDSYRFHNSRYAWEQDRRRRSEARGRGDAHRSYTWEDMREPAPMLGELRALLASLHASRRGVRVA
jgi:hypothetical protein